MLHLLTKLAFLTLKSSESFLKLPATLITKLSILFLMLFVVMLLDQLSQNFPDFFV